MPNFAIPISDIQLSEAAMAKAHAATYHSSISGTGEFVRQAEIALANVFGEDMFANLTANGTVALQVALRAVGVNAGDVVIVPNFTFIAPATAALWIGAKVHIVDINDNYTIDWNQVGNAIDEFTARGQQVGAIVAVDTFGMPCDYDLAGIIMRDGYFKGVPVIQDIAEAHGSRFGNERVGRQGVVSILSFHANKPITCGEGGAILTKSPELQRKITTIINHGMDRASNTPYWHEEIGTNARISNISAAILLENITHWDEITDARNKVALMYEKALEDSFLTHPELIKPIAFSQDWEYLGFSTWLYAIHIKNADVRDRVITHMRADSLVDARATWETINRQPAIMALIEAGQSVTVSSKLTNSYDCANTLVILPTYNHMTKKQVDFVVNRLKQAIFS